MVINCRYVQKRKSMKTRKLHNFSYSGGWQLHVYVFLHQIQVCLHWFMPEFAIIGKLSLRNAFQTITLNWVMCPSYYQKILKFSLHTSSFTWFQLKKKWRKVVKLFLFSHLTYSLTILLSRNTIIISNMCELFVVIKLAFFCIQDIYSQVHATWFHD